MLTSQSSSGELMLAEFDLSCNKGPVTITYYPMPGSRSAESDFDVKLLENGYHGTQGEKDGLIADGSHIE